MKVIEAMQISQALQEASKLSFLNFKVQNSLDKLSDYWAQTTFKDMKEPEDLRLICSFKSQGTKIESDLDKFLNQNSLRPFAAQKTWSPDLNGNQIPC